MHRVCVPRGGGGGEAEVWPLRENRFGPFWFIYYILCFLSFIWYEVSLDSLKKLSISLSL